ncbi:hypothetical protein RJ641_005803 [Dillenia turbinata]|uniref:DUF7880 domain-containing protein n=1 Tax=Dillenia turbinata TaxID=194707 RepID=A0AAN8Z705_9MAGN
MGGMAWMLSNAQVSIDILVGFPISAKKRNINRIRCAVYQRQRQRQQQKSRRDVTVSLVLLNCFCLSLPTRGANAASIFDKYLKRKKLDPLDSYVPAVLLTRFQIKDLGKLHVGYTVLVLGGYVFITDKVVVEKTLELDQPQYATCRSLLRTGPAASLRVNIRAMAQYASDDGNGQTAFNDVDRCLRALEDLDSLLLHASRNEPDASVAAMKTKISIALGALDSLLQTVPSDVLDKGKKIADAYRIADEDEDPKYLDPEMKRLESIL